MHYVIILFVCFIFLFFWFLFSFDFGGNSLRGEKGSAGSSRRAVGWVWAGCGLKCWPGPPLAKALSQQPAILSSCLSFQPKHPQPHRTSNCLSVWHATLTLSTCRGCQPFHRLLPRGQDCHCHCRCHQQKKSCWFASRIAYQHFLFHCLFADMANVYAIFLH